MAEYPPPPPPPSSPPPAPATNNPDPTQYWCYQCDKRVPVETLADNSEIICFECKNGFVESISVGAHNREVSDEDTPAFGNEFLQVLRLIAQAAREDDEPPPPPSDRPSGDNDYLRIELDGWDNGNVNVNEDGDEDEEEDPYQGDQARAQFLVHDDDDDHDDLEEEDEDDEEEEEIQNRNLEEDEEDFVRRERRDVLRLRLRDFASRAASRRNRILDWAEILMGLEDQSIEFRLQVPGDHDDDGYVGNPGDYVDAAGYEALLQNLAENDTGGRRGAPPAAKSAVEKLQTVEVNSTNMEICAICKDRVFNNEDKIAKQLECGHMYHEDCIVPWLGSRNTCPICRYELPTDDPEYEEDRKKRLITMAAASGTDHGCSSSSGGDGDGDGGGD